MQSPDPRPFAVTRRPRTAFTLLELLIAISIIAILASLILYVAGSANVTAHNAQVSADIQNLTQSIAQFKNRFGVEPPSRIVLYEKAAGWSGDPRSMGLIRQLWPQFDFTYNAEGGQIDINGDGLFTGDTTAGNASTGAIPLNGAECLVFFLGGVPGNLSPLAFGGAPSGFAQNPADPFSVTVAGGVRTVVGTNRDRFGEFDAGRLFLFSGRTMNTYKDTLSAQTQPYLYLSSYGGQGYDVQNELLAGPPGTGAANNNFTDVYRQGPNGFGSASPSAPWNPNSFQIISPGADTAYGLGGEYESGDPKGLLVGNRSTERDNITNFNSGPLAP